MACCRANEPIECPIRNSGSSGCSAPTARLTVTRSATSPSQPASPKLPRETPLPTDAPCPKWSCERTAKPAEIRAAGSRSYRAACSATPCEICTTPRSSTGSGQAYVVSGSPSTGVGKVLEVYVVVTHRTLCPPSFLPDGKTGLVVTRIAGGMLLQCTTCVTHRSS